MDGKIIRKKLIGSEEERAVSPVIGVILMVAITVILAAVIAAFVLDIGPGDGGIAANVDVSGDGTDEVQVSVEDGGSAENIVIVKAGTGELVDDDDLEPHGDTNDEDIEDSTVPESANTGATYNIISEHSDEDGESSFIENDEEAKFEDGDYEVWAINGELEGGDVVDDADSSLQLTDFTLPASD